MAKRIRGKGSRQRWKQRRLEIYKANQMQRVTFTPPPPTKDTQPEKIVDYFPIVIPPPVVNKPVIPPPVLPPPVLSDCEQRLAALLSNENAMAEFRKKIEASGQTVVMMQ